MTRHSDWPAGLGSGGRVTIGDLAHEFGLSVRRVLDEANRMGANAYDAATIVPDDTVFALWPRLADLGAPNPHKASDPPAEPAVSSLGSQVHEALTQEIMTRWPLRRSEAADLAARWAGRGLDVDRVRPFWSAGFGPYDHGLVAQCVDQGLTAAQLADPTRARDLVRRLRGGETVASVMARGDT